MMDRSRLTAPHHIQPMQSGVTHQPPSKGYLHNAQTQASKQPASRAMELVTGALGSLIPKLKDLLKEEYKMQTGVKDQIRSLELELEAAYATLCKVAVVRPDQLDELVKLWAREVREASYDMEDILDTYLLRVEGSHQANDKESLVKGLAEKMTGLFKKSKERHKIAGAIEKIRKNLQEVTELRGRFTVDSILAKPAVSSRTVDPRLTAMYREVTQIDKSSAELISVLSLDDEFEKNVKIVSVVGFGGLGKTTLAKAVYDKLKSLFGYRAFVPVGQDPDLKKVLRDILMDLDNERYTAMRFTTWDESQLICELRDILETKRYFVVIDDIWEHHSWTIIRYAFPENNCGSRIIITTRSFDVAKRASGVYKLKPLSHDNSKKLFYTRLFGGEDKCPSNHVVELSDMILKKCGGVPLAIITMASLLLGKSRKDWIEVCNSPGFYQDKDGMHMANTMHILSLSYYDLPSHLKTCLLYLSVFPEYSLIYKGSLIWKWIAEGFVEKKPGRGLFEVGEEYFHDLINRSLIQQVEIKGTDLVYGQVHDMVLDLVRHLSRQENFVFVLNKGSETFQSCQFRRWLAIHNKKEEHSHGDNMNLLPLLRSLTAIECPIYMIPPVFSFKLLRVLDLESCLSMEGYNLKHLGELLLLRFISLRNTFVRTLPEELRNVKMLQTLELEGSGVEELPASMGELAGLMCLNTNWTTRVPDWIGMLTSLEQLVMYPGGGNDKHSVTWFVNGLGNLTELRELRFLIKADDEKQLRDLLQSLSNLPKIEVIHFDFYGVQWERGVQFEPTGFALSKSLRFLELPWFEFSSLPSWINAQDLPQLCHLSLKLFDVDEQDLEKLGRFMELRHLQLLIVNTERSHAITCASGFQNLRLCSISTKPFKFLQGAMPMLEVLYFHFNVWLQSGAHSNSDFDFGLESLPSLQQVIVQINCLDAFPEKVEKTEAALRRAIHMHPNHPNLEISISRRKLQKADNDGENDISNSDKGKGVEVAEGHRNSVSYTKSLSLERDGIDEPMEEIIKMLSVVDNNDIYNKKMRIVPIVRSEGRKLKTTLAQKVFDKLRPQFDCAAFVLVGQNPDMRKVFTDILIGLDRQEFQDFDMTMLQLMELIGLVRKSLINKRFFVVVDDIWDLKAWDIIKCSLIENSNGSAILTTSPNIDITMAIGGGKQLLRLSAEDTKKIFCKKLFGSENRCPPELDNICDNLIKTCDGMLAVIEEIVSSLERVEPTVKEWQEVYEKRKLALSYPKLPDYLKKSLLYFSMFPKGSVISAERLVWAWIAEDFVQETQRPQDLQNVQKSYLSELIKKNMIEAVEVDADGMALSCRAYDLVHDFIVLKSTEEQKYTFAILNDSQDRALSTIVDRLSIQGNHSQHKAWFSTVRSLVAACENLPPISGFTNLRVMDLAGCGSLQDSHLKDMKKTNSLRYLAIGGKYIARIPKDIMKRFTDLQTLDLSASGLNELPKSVFSLRKLVCLRVSSHMKIPGGIEDMPALQELGDINIVKPELLKRLRKLRQLRVLRIALWSWDEGFKSSAEQWWDTLLSVMGFFKNIESLCILTFCSLDFMDGSGDKWPPHQTLQKLEIRHRAFHDKLPSWFVSLCNISSLTIEVNKLSENIISTVGKLSALCSLSLTSKEESEVQFDIVPDAFKKLESLKFVCNAMLEMFAGPQSNDSQSQKLKRLTIVFQASRTKDINKDFKFGLDNLRSLEHVRVEINCYNASRQMVKNAEDAIRNEISSVGSGSNQPNLEIRRLEEESMVEEDQARGHPVATTSSSSIMKTMQAEPVVVRQTPMSNVEVVSKVLYHKISNNTFLKNVGILMSSTKIDHNISNNKFLKNVGILMSSTKIEKSSKRTLQQKQTTEQQCSIALHNEVDKLKQALANTQRELEEFKKQIEEKICSLSVYCT